MAKITLKKSNLVGSTAHKFGYAVERELTRAFQRAGYLAVNDMFMGHDIKVINLQTGNCVTIEVKASRLAKDNRYHATLVKSGRYGSTNAYVSDYIIFVTLGKKLNLYIIPTSEISSRQITIPNDPNYSGKWAKYRTDRLEI